MTDGPAQAGEFDGKAFAAGLVGRVLRLQQHQFALQGFFN